MYISTKISTKILVNKKETKLKVLNEEFTSKYYHYHITIDHEQIIMRNMKWLNNRKIKFGSKRNYIEMRTKQGVRCKEQQPTIGFSHCNARNNLVGLSIGN